MIHFSEFGMENYMNTVALLGIPGLVELLSHSAVFQ